MGGEFVELPGFEGVEHPHVAHRQGDGGLRLVLEQADGLPAGGVVVFGDAALQPDRRAGNQQGVQAGRVAGAFVEQVLQTAADFDCEDINEWVGCGAAEPEPQSVGKGAHAGGTWDFQRGRVVFQRGAGSCF